MVLKGVPSGAEDCDGKHGHHSKEAAIAQGHMPSRITAVNSSHKIKGYCSRSVCRSVGRSVGRSVCRSVGLSVCVSARFLSNSGCCRYQTWICWYVERALGTARVWSGVVQEQHVYGGGLTLYSAIILGVH